MPGQRVIVVGAGIVGASVAEGAAAADTFRLVGRMYGHCATPQPQITLATAPMASSRAPRCERRSSSTSEPSPHSAETTARGSARAVKPSNT